jgi:MPBQ/MSBQ methyltransferase
MFGPGAETPDADVTGITLSPKQSGEVPNLLSSRIPKCKVYGSRCFGRVCARFDIIIGLAKVVNIIPDKKAYIEQMMRVLKPGGKFVAATWCQRDDRKVHFDKRGKARLAIFVRRMVARYWCFFFFLGFGRFWALVATVLVKRKLS